MHPAAGTCLAVEGCGEVGYIMSIMRVVVVVIIVVVGYMEVVVVHAVYIGCMVLSSGSIVKYIYTILLCMYVL